MPRVLAVLIALSRHDSDRDGWITVNYEQFMKVLRTLSMAGYNRHPNTSSSRSDILRSPLRGRTLQTGVSRELAACNPDGLISFESWFSHLTVVDDMMKP